MHPRFDRARLRRVRSRHQVGFVATLVSSCLLGAVAAQPTAAGPAQSTPDGPPAYEVEVAEVRGPSGGGFVPVELNIRGQVSGILPDPSSPWGGGAPALWDDGTTTVLAPAGVGVPYGLNAWGEVVGAIAPPGEASRGFWWRSGTAHEAPVAALYDVNEVGQAVGVRTRPDGGWDTVVWSRAGETVVPLDPTARFLPNEITNDGRVVGALVDAGQAYTAATWTPRDGVTVVEPPGADSSIAFAATEAGLVVGEYSTPDGSRRAFSWWAGRASDLGALPGGVDTRLVPGSTSAPNSPDAVAQAHGRKVANLRGEVIGTSFTGDGLPRGFVWHRGTLTDLGDLPGGCLATLPRAINSWGQVVGLCAGVDGVRVFLWDDGEMADLGDAAVLGTPIDVNEVGQVLTWTVDPVLGTYGGQVLTVTR